MQAQTWDAQTWIAVASAAAAVASAAAAVGSALVAWKALSYNRQSASQADRAARAAEEQTNLQQQIRIEAAQPYVWVDIRPDEASGVLLTLVVGNSGPTLARDVHVTVDQPLPFVDELRERVEAAQARLANGISALPPGRVLRWPLGQGYNLITDAGPQRYTFTVKANGPFGGLPTSTHVVDLADYRGHMERPAGSLRELTKAVEGVSGSLSDLPFRLAPLLDSGADGTAPSASPAP